ncbi:MAG TPA: NADH-quinone oxidoreductase subunit N, partial [Desulfurivibrionaceae bacterium]|nr:NADH-quinone oxidoreductase subunit N [Desulfurivibrionaceae bacterium]
MKLILFVPELLVLFGCLLLYLTCIFNGSGRLARTVAGVLAVGGILLTAATFCLSGSLFFDAYRVDLFSQLFKFLVSVGLAVVILFDR